MNGRDIAPFRVVIMVGAIYALTGIVFALPTGHARFWRLAAWGLSGVVYVLHLWWERRRRGNSTLTSAGHVALGAALGAFGLAVGAMLHSLSVTSTTRHQQLLVIAFVAWPAITAVPAFLVGLALGAVMGRTGRG